MLMFFEPAPHTVTAEQLALFPQRNMTVWENLSDAHTVLAIRDGEELIGCALLAKTDHADDAVCVTLADLNIREDFRRQGMGRTLLSVAASKAMQWGVSVLYANTPTDDIAMAFCRKTGFAPHASGQLVLDLTNTQGMRHGG